jgi:glycosyltransferase involved in cell wall biosynthesis
MKKFVQLVHTLSYGDAISGEVISLDRCMQEMGYDTEIYSLHCHPRLEGQAKKYTELSAEFNGEVVLHYSLGSPLNALYESLSAATRSIIYHNLTPARWFAGVNPRVKADIETGIKELPGLLKISDRILADSTFNAGELVAIGFQAQVLELPVDPARWQGGENEGISQIVRGEPGIHLLHIGRLAPNKCIEDIIKMFYFLHHKITDASKLWLVGIDIDTELYSFSLKRLAHELSLEKSVQFVGCLSDEEIRSLYTHCDAYICMSEHEGFCLPVVEAMHFGLPVLAYDASAVPDTVGNGGIVVSEKKHPQMAELVYRMCTDQPLRERLIRAGRSRVQELSYERFGARVKELFDSSGGEQRVAAVGQSA